MSRSPALRLASPPLNRRRRRALQRDPDALLVTVPVGAALLGLSPATLRRMLERGAIPVGIAVVFPGGLVRLKRKPLLSWAGASVEDGPG